MHEMNIIRVIKAYIIRSIGLLFYFTAFPFIIYGLFTAPLGNIYLLYGVSSMLIGIIIQVNLYGNEKKAFRRMAIITLIPLIIFTAFNIALTAGTANIIRGEIDEGIAELPQFLQGMVRVVIENYTRIIPGLWITAIAYAIMVMIFMRLSSRR
jgi:hypothetical protein